VTSVAGASAADGHSNQCVRAKQEPPAPFHVAVHPLGLPFEGPGAKTYVLVHPPGLTQAVPGALTQFEVCAHFSREFCVSAN
jgi:hypothetical protein